MPKTRTANLIVAGAILIAIVVAMTSPIWGDTDFSLPIVFLLLLGLMTLVACAVCNPWLIPVPVIVLLLGSYSEAFQFYLFSTAHRMYWGPLVAPNRAVEELWKEIRRFQIALRVILVLGDFLALLALERLSRPRKASFPPIRFITSLAKSWRRTPIAQAHPRHPFIESH